ncbi:hypothetical protein PR048_003095 [Dryococelus australis]|uniref:Uncharacterized protein n=1 Tax=Dryococelus australis TaxID=614101 RepID=A0ABQ9INJ9_9NEOP|nr:hypothetical protein PR048_003095 [Dryococelus australis]
MTEMVSHLKHAENRLQRASALANTVDSDSSKCRLFISTCHDLPDMKTSFENDHLTFKLKCKTKVDLDQGKYTENMGEFYDLYNYIMAILDTTLIINNQDLSNVESCTYLKLALKGEPLALVVTAFDR